MHDIKTTKFRCEHCKIEITLVGTDEQTCPLCKNFMSKTSKNNVPKKAIEAKVAKENKSQIKGFISMLKDIIKKAIE